MPTGIPITPDQFREAIRLQAQLWTLDRIASHLGLHPVSLCRALNRHNRRAMARLEKRTAAIKAKQVRQLETIAGEAYDAWLHSKTPKTVDRSTDDGQGETVTHESSTHHCDAALLNQARGALADVRKILGLDSADKVEQSGEIRVIVDYADLPSHAAEAAPGPAEDPGGGDPI